MGANRDLLRLSFETAASSYHQARPEYPEELYEDLVREARLEPGDSLLEIGPGTGKATLPLARRGFRVTALEPGQRLAAEARRNLSGFSVEVVESSFEDWGPPGAARFKLVFGATSWHWAAPSVKYEHAWSVLAPGGHLAFWAAEHVFPAGGDTFFDEIQPVYDEIEEGLPLGAPRPRPGELDDGREEVAATGLFDLTYVRHFDWELIYDAEAYIALLNTFSGHISMPEWKRDRLYGEIRRRLAQRPDGALRRHWGAVLSVARRRDG